MYGRPEVLQLPLSDLRIRKMEPKEKPYMVRDDRGLYLEVLPNGAKYWRIRTWSNGKEKKRSLGVYPVVSLARARQKRDEIQATIAAGQEPFKDKPRGVTFSEVVKEWLEKKVYPIRVQRHAECLESRLNRFVLPHIGNIPIESIQAADLLEVMRRIEARGIHETAHRVLQSCGQVFRYAVATARCQRDPSGDLRGALQPAKIEHRASITDPKEIGGLMRAIDGFAGSPIVKAALLLGVYTFVRPGELRQAEWAEVDLDKAEWKIPAAKMKMRRPHIVPLSTQSKHVLRSIHILTGQERYVFPSMRTTERPISENTVNAALRRMGYAKEELTGHGFRSMASTILNEQGWPPDAIERQLAHLDRDPVRAAYNYAELLDVRRKMMGHWANWLDEQKGK